MLTASIFEAIVARDIARVRDLIAGGLDTQQLNSNGETPLEVAASLGNLEIVQILVEARHRSIPPALLQAALLAAA